MLAGYPVTVKTCDGKYRISGLFSMRSKNTDQPWRNHINQIADGKFLFEQQTRSHHVIAHTMS